MKTENGLDINPLWIYIIWILIIILLGIIVIPILSIGTSGGEQKPYILMESFMVVLIYGLLFLSFIISILYWNWYKKYWYINVSIFLFCFLLLFNVYWDNKEETYYQDETKYFGNDELFIRKEYGVKNNQIISIKYWKNDRKDSTWIFYDKKGNIVEERFYQNDSLVKSIQR